MDSRFLSHKLPATDQRGTVLIRFILPSKSKSSQIDEMGLEDGQQPRTLSSYPARTGLLVCLWYTESSPDSGECGGFSAGMRCCACGHARLASVGTADI